MHHIKWNNRCGLISPLFTVGLIFFYSLQPSAAQLFWMWSVPGLSLDTAATILSPQQDPKPCQSYKPGFREAEDDNQQERGNAEQREYGIRVWIQGVRGGGSHRQKVTATEKIQTLFKPWDFSPNVLKLSEIICIQTCHVSKIKLQRPLVIQFFFHSHYAQTHSAAKRLLGFSVQQHPLCIIASFVSIWWQSLSHKPYSYNKNSYSFCDVGYVNVLWYLGTTTCFNAKAAWWAFCHVNKVC